VSSGYFYFNIIFFQENNVKIKKYPNGMVAGIGGPVKGASSSVALICIENAATSRSLNNCTKGVSFKWG